MSWAPQVSPVVFDDVSPAVPYCVLGIKGALCLLVLVDRLFTCREFRVNKFPSVGIFCTSLS